MEKEFCLLYEPWIRVMKMDGETIEVSLLDVFRYAPELLRLAGELPTQDIAMLRLLLAVLHSVFERYDLDGEWAPFAEPADALKRWKELWDRGSFPMDIIEDYLTHYEDRFYLFHPQFPFYQVAGLDKATEYTAGKLNGELSESSNKIRLFPQRTGKNKEMLGFAEAARWLLYINAFDDTSAKPKGKGLPSPGVGWLGRLGLITGVGNNLFETLLLNLVLIKDGEYELWGEPLPVWEVEEVKSDERTKISVPDNLPQLYTLQSRRLFLKRHENYVTGYLLLGGDFFDRENAFIEHMTIWRNAARRSSDTPEYHPRRHNPSRQLWRDFSVLAGQSETIRRPGIVNWIARLRTEGLIPHTHINFQTASVKYGDKDFFIDDVFSDSLSFNLDLLTDLGEDWTMRIVDEISTADRLVFQVGLLAQNLARASGDSDGNAQKNMAMEQGYFRLDMPFRRWLEGIDPKRDSINESCARWWEQEKQVIRSLGRELINQASPQAFVGRIKVDERNNREYRYNAPEAYNRFLYRTSSREALLERGE